MPVLCSFKIIYFFHSTSNNAFISFLFLHFSFPFFLSLHVFICHPLIVFCSHLCWCEFTVRLYPHSTRLCGSYYRQVLLKDRRTFPLWFRYSKLHECLSFSWLTGWAWSSCTHLHMQLWWCSVHSALVTEFDPWMDALWWKKAVFNSNKQ